ncbi:transposase [Devosia sp. CC-YST696]|nr:transposase [Devosia faecipullorum]
MPGNWCCVASGFFPSVYRRRHRIESLFARLKDWRRIATRYDRCAGTLMTAITIAAIRICWINKSQVGQRYSIWQSYNHSCSPSAAAL